MDILHVDVAGGHAIATQANVLIVLHRQQSTAQKVERAHAEATKLFRAHPEGIGLLIVLEANARPPDDGALAAVTHWMRHDTTGVRARVRVHEGTGFRAAFFRSVMLTLHRLGRPKSPDHVSPTVQDGATRLESELATSSVGCPTASELIRTVEELRVELNSLAKGRANPRP